MAILGGEFALIMLITGASGQLEKIEQGTSALEERLGLRIVTKRTERGQTHAGYLPYSLKVTGFDRPGIVHQVSELLARLDVNVRLLESRVSFAPLSGTPMFILEAELQVPNSATLKELRKGLELTCGEVDLDFTLEASG
jgi:glycine cleavage system transcriptional repressor